MKNTISWFVENHVAANLLMFFILLGGLVIAFGIKVEVFPESTLDKISITAIYPGASPSEIEESVVRKIEEKIAGLAGIKQIDSTSREGAGIVTVDVMAGWDVKSLLDEIKSEVDRISTFPEDIESPVIKEIVRKSRVINIAIYGDTSESVLKFLAEKVKDDLTNISGITLADVVAVKKNEIHIEISENNLRKYGLTIAQVSNIIKTASFDMPAGSVKTENGEILIRTKGRKYYADSFRDIALITRNDGTAVTLGQIAALKEGFEDIDYLFRFMGKPASMINVYRVADQNALDVAAKVKKYISELRPSLPKGIYVDDFGDMSELLRSRLSLLSRNMLMGLVLVCIVAFVFLGNLRNALIMLCSLPFSVLLAITMMNAVY